MGIGDALGKLGDLNKLRQQAMQMQKNLAVQQVVVEENGVKVVMSGDQRILSLEIQGLSNQVLNDVLNKAIRKSQELAAKELMNVSGGMDRFAGALSALKKDTVECSRCHNIAENDPCDICSDPGRDKTMICVVEQPLDVVALERGNGYRGGYHVLHGEIDPLHNIGADEIRIRELLVRLRTFDSAAGFGEVKEVILALNPNMEGEATCMYILRQVKSQDAKVKGTRLAHGVPVGADIGYAGDRTLSRA